MKEDEGFWERGFCILYILMTSSWLDVNSELTKSVKVSFEFETDGDVVTSEPPSIEYL